MKRHKSRRCGLTWQGKLALRQGEHRCGCKRGHLGPCRCEDCTARIDYTPKPPKRRGSPHDQA